jgi:hypothetical protein
MRPRQSPDLLVKMLPEMGRSPMRVATGWAVRTDIRTGFRWSGRIPIEQTFQRLQCGLWRRRRVILPVCKDIAFSC